jgi:serine/threonine-protein kinase RsbW
MNGKKSCTFPGRHESLSEISAFVTEAAEAAGLPPKTVYEVQLAVDEACSNIIDHAYGGEGEGDIECTCHVTEDGLTVKLRDHGESFDPESISSPDLHADLEERTTGGLGLYFIRKLMDDVDFEFQEADGANLLTLVKYREKSS